MKLRSLVKLVRATVRLVRDPNRLDEVIDLADDISDTSAFDAILDHVRRQPDGPVALAARARIRLDLPRLRALPPGTFGHAAARFLDERGLDPEAFPRRPTPDGNTWLRAHLYESHDLWHVATGFDTDVAGEAGLQAFYLAQFPARLASILLAIVFFNTFLYRFDEKDARMDAIVRGWQLGKTARQLIGVRWDELWEQPLAEVRARLDLPVAGVELAPVRAAA